MQDAGFSPDLTAMPLSKLQNQLKNARLLPSQQMLGEHVDEHFAILAQHGIENLAQLQQVLKNKTAQDAFIARTGLPQDYLTLLRREVNSYLPKPVALADFPGVNPKAVNGLAVMGVKNSKQLFPLVLTPQQRQALARQVGIPEVDLLELARLVDLARLKWVGPRFARLLLEAGYDSVAKVAAADAGELDATIRRVNAEKDIYQAALGKEDLRRWLEGPVQDTPRVIAW